MTKRKVRIPILPNLITTGSMFFGFYCIVNAIHGNYLIAAWAILGSALCDVLDGRVARVMNSTSDFGMAYDSLSDLMSFGFAPAMLAYFWVLKPYGNLGWAAAFLYIVCAALRLARFNVQVEETEKGGFIGIPSPMAAGLVCSTVGMHQVHFAVGGSGPLMKGVPALAIIVGMYLVALLMVSNVQFRSSKVIDFKKIGPFKLLVASVIIIAGVIQLKEIAIFGMSFTYLAVGIYDLVMGKKKDKDGDGLLEDWAEVEGGEPDPDDEKLRRIK